MVEGGQSTEEPSPTESVAVWPPRALPGMAVSLPPQQVFKMGSQDRFCQLFQLMSWVDLPSSFLHSPFSLNSPQAISQSLHSSSFFSNLCFWNGTGEGMWAQHSGNLSSLENFLQALIAVSQDICAMFITLRRTSEFNIAGWTWHPGLKWLCDFSKSCMCVLSQRQYYFSNNSKFHAVHFLVYFIYAFINSPDI